MIFELMSRGNIVELPKESGDDENSVTLLLPFGRALRGFFSDGGERWVLGRQGEGDAGKNSSEEIFLCDAQPCTLFFDGQHRATLSAQVCDELRSALLSKHSPPGVHANAAAILRGMTTEPEILNDEMFVFDEERALATLKEKDEERAAYWGVRFALARGEHEAVMRIKAWYRAAPHVAFCEPCVRVWFSLTQTPDREIFDEITSLGFSPDDVQRVAVQGTSPVVLFSRGGYLLLASYGDGNRGTLFREWAYFPSLIWNELRERGRITLRELLVLAWGAHDAQNALKMSERYQKREE